MIKPIQRRKRSKITTILLAPIFAVVFLIGWSLNCAGQSSHKQQQKTTNKIPTQPDNIQLEVIPRPEEQIITN